MEINDKKPHDIDPGKDRPKNNPPLQDGNIGHPTQPSQQDGAKMGANRDDDTMPKGEDEH